MERRYKDYIADALMCISENAAELGKHRYMAVSFADLVSKPKKKERPKKSGPEIAAGIIKGLQDGSV